MSDTVTVTHLVAGTVADETWTAERITFQHFRGGRALLKLHRGGQVAEYVSYGRVERIHRVVTREDA